MPSKFITYKIICLITLFLCLFVFLDFLYLVIFPGNTSIEIDFTFLLFFLCILIYILNCIWGIRLARLRSTNGTVTKKQRRIIRIYFIIQLVLQLIFLVTSIPGIIRFYINTLNGLYNGLRIWGYNIIFVQSAVVGVFLLTLYYEMVTFQLIKEIRKNHIAEWKKINNLGMPD